MNDVIGTLSNNEKLVGVGIGGALLGGALGFATSSAINKRRKKSRRKPKHNNTRKRSSNNKRSRTSRSRRSKQKQPYTARKKPDTSRTRIRYTKNNQPYVIVYRNINGKRRKMAKFIKKSSAARSKHLSGGRY
jgi:hypothetical protein